MVLLIWELRAAIFSIETRYDDNAVFTAPQFYFVYFIRKDRLSLINFETVHGFS
jgi:hypothetical protein